MSFITFEGGEGAGKSTLLKKVGRYLRSQRGRVLLTRAPGGTQLGRALRRLLLGQRHAALSSRAELFLFLADRAQHVDEVIRPALKEGHTVLCDRFNDSTLAYQGAGRGFAAEWLVALLDFATNDLQPTLTFYLDIDPESGCLRAQKAKKGRDRLEREALLFHKKVRAAFLERVRKDPKRFCTIDATLPPEVVFEHAKRRLDALFRSSRK